MELYLQHTDIINWQHSSILLKASELAATCHSATEIAAACFYFVRDHIKHSWDFRQGPVTCIASDVLAFGTGYCYAKSHLLAALLRANGLPAGLCYQRLTIDGVEPPFCLHGLNAVYLPDIGWYRLDARGNKTGVAAEFCPPLEKLAFLIAQPGEADLGEIYAEPLPEVIQVLRGASTIEEVMQNLPDINLETSVGSPKSAQVLGAPRTQKCRTTNQVARHF